MYNIKNSCVIVAVFTIIAVGCASENDVKSKPITFVTIRNPDVHEPVYLKIAATGTYQDIYGAYIGRVKPRYFVLFVDGNCILRPREKYDCAHIGGTFRVIVPEYLPDFNLSDNAVQVGFSSWTSDNAWGFYFKWLDTYKFS